MKRSRTLGLMLSILTLALFLSACGGKKDKKEEPVTPAPVSTEQGFAINPCPVARIEISPEKSENDGVTIGSMAEVKLTATAYDAEGKVLNVPLTWRFRHPDTCGINTAGGHKLEVVDNNHATFRAAGLAQGEFVIIAEDQGCNLVNDKDKPCYVEGLSWVRVHNKPGLEVSCGRMRATYGDDVDQIGQKVMASSKQTLIAEITGPANAPSNYIVRFYYNDKAAPEVQRLHRDVDWDQDTDQHRHFRAMLPLYLTPGEYCVRYELLKAEPFKKPELVCGSGTERFIAR